MTQLILCDRGDEHQVIEEEKAAWIRDVLIAIGVDEEIIDDEDRMGFKTYCDANGIDVEENLADGSVIISRTDMNSGQEKIIGEWKYPKLVMKKEAKNKYYYEIRLNEWALPFQMKERR